MIRALSRAIIASNGVLTDDWVVVRVILGREALGKIDALHVVLGKAELIQWIVHWYQGARIFRSADLNLGQREDDGYSVLVSLRIGHLLTRQERIPKGKPEAFKYGFCRTTQEFGCYICSVQEQSLLENCVSDKAMVTVT